MSSTGVFDYRVSRLIVLCKDCGEDVGMYPSRHKCRTPDRPPLPTLVVPKAEQAVTTYWEMLKNTLWSTEGSTAASDESPGSLVWNRIMEATSTVARVVGVGGVDESDSDEDENGETKVTRELKAYYEKKGKGMPEFLLNKSSGRSPQGALKEGGHQNRENDSQHGKNEDVEPSQARGRIVQRAPIPIRKAPLREEDDGQEHVRQRERELAERERGRERRRQLRERKAERRKEERKRTEREAALAALDGRRDSSSSASRGEWPFRKGPSPEQMRPVRGRADPRTGRSPNYNERSPSRRQGPAANEQPCFPAQQPLLYDQQPSYGRAPIPALGSAPSRSKLGMQPPRRIPPEYSQLRPNSPNPARLVDGRSGMERTLRGDGSGIDPRKALVDRRVMMDPGRLESRYAMREPGRKDQINLAGGQELGRKIGQVERRDYEAR